ncbi:restriction endonuclease subunit S [Aeromonas caviae]|uniref:restriction endonuclease subunit S n=1 Tax=Aeromonas caviae TaxID=648 RepID=UPI00309A60BF
MSSNWDWIRLGDYCSKIGSGATPSGGKSSYLDFGPFCLIRSQNIYNDGFTPSGLAYISLEQAKKLESVSVEENDVLLNITGDSVARVCLALGQYLPARVNQHVAIIRPLEEKLDSRFLRYFLASPTQQNLMLGMAAAGATRNALTKVMIENFKVPCPPLEQQKQIAAILALFDDRAALLRKTNAILEAIAQALFKSWFVDFDPVHARARGEQPPGLAPEVAALFPDSLEESELGIVPKGWSWNVLGDVCAAHGGKIQTGPFGSQLHASDYVQEGTPVVMPKDISGRRVDGGTAARIGMADVERLSRHQLQIGDIVFSRRGDVEKHALIGELEQGWLCGTGCLLVRPGKNWSSPGFLSRLLDLQSTKRWLTQHAVGATMPNLNTGILAAVPVLLPSREVLIEFEQLTHVLDTRISENNATIQTLSNLRDTLLPRLISGQLRLPDAEAMVSEAQA